MSQAHQGVKLSKEHVNSISKGHKGLIKSKQHRKNLSISLIGKEITEKTKRLISINTRIGMNNEDTRRKLREHRATQILPKKDTSIEVKIQDFLKQLGITFFTHQYIKEIEHGYQCDILIPSMNLVIECDGNYWHKYSTGREIDHIRTKELLKKGFKVLRLWEIDIINMDVKDFKSKLNKLGVKN